jgi:molybdopterin synthase catalytic subunit
MSFFRFSNTALEVATYQRDLGDPAAGGYASFEGWVRNHNEGLAVTRLEYEAFEALANKEGERIVAEAIQRFGVIEAACVHRVGSLAIGDLAVWVGVSSRHRAEAFAACRFIIDEVKHRVPIWKKEHYVNGDSGWVNCERCAEHADEAGRRLETRGASQKTKHQHNDGACGAHSSLAQASSLKPQTLPD